MTDSSPEPTAPAPAPTAPGPSAPAPATPAPATPAPATPAPATHAHDESGTSPASSHEEIDLDAVERDLAAVEIALERLSEGSYWTDEVTGEPIPEHVLTDDPTARRA